MNNLEKRIKKDKKKTISLVERIRNNRRNLQNVM